MMLTRDEIIGLIKEEAFSIRHVFYDAIDDEGKRHISVDPASKIKLQWPHALSVLTLEDWNNAYERAIKFKESIK